LKPKSLFLADGIGALTTAVFLFIILRTYHEFFGMPQAIVTYLSIIAAIFCVYSISCFLFLDSNWEPFLRTICIANLLYCCLTIALVVFFYHSITIFGITYFLIEIVAICVLVLVELKTLSRLAKK